MRRRLWCRRMRNRLCCRRRRSRLRRGCRRRRMRRRLCCRRNGRQRCGRGQLSRRRCRIRSRSANAVAVRGRCRGRCSGPVSLTAPTKRQVRCRRHRDRRPFSPRLIGLLRLHNLHLLLRSGTVQGRHCFDDVLSVFVVQAGPTPLQKFLHLLGIVHPGTLLLHLPQHLLHATTEMHLGHCCPRPLHDRRRRGRRALCPRRGGCRRRLHCVGAEDSKCRLFAAKPRRAQGLLAPARPAARCVRNSVRAGLGRRASQARAPEPGAQGEVPMTSARGFASSRREDVWLTLLLGRGSLAAVHMLVATLPRDGSRERTRRKRHRRRCRGNRSSSGRLWHLCCLPTTPDDTDSVLEGI
mmetsp:Transcript_12566/g.44532  ORF Transcript_12566/g.44532 Transcript_12566/m.44532 type:complete len:353 (-) Transcript_12566:644-1702(-)